MERMANISVDELSHHGILGMKWGIRRFQKYPAGYRGDGKYVGPDGQPRQPTRAEAKQDRKYNELKRKIDRWANEAIATGDKKKLKLLKKTMSPEQYQEVYNEMVKKGVERAVKTMDKAELSKYKDDISPNEYKDRSLLIEFNDAVNRLDTKTMNQLASRMNNEVLKEATQRIATMTEFQNKKIGALKVEGEGTVKLAKLANTAGNIASIAGSAKKVYDVINTLQKDKEARYDAEKEKAQKKAKEIRDKQINEIIRSGDIKKINSARNQMTTNQLEDAYKSAYYKHKTAVDQAAITQDPDELKKWAALIGFSNARQKK